jgi:hypothetical protein
MVMFQDGSIIEHKVVNLGDCNLLFSLLRENNGKEAVDLKVREIGPLLYVQTDSAKGCNS